MIENEFPNNLRDTRINKLPISKDSPLLFYGAIEVKNPQNYVWEGYILATISKFEIPALIKDDVEQKYSINRLYANHVCSTCDSVRRWVNWRITIVIFAQKRMWFQGPYIDGMDVIDSRFPAVATLCNCTENLVYSVCTECPIKN